MAQQRLPIVNSDDGTWGDIIRQYLMKEHYNDDTDNPVNGGHQKITIRPGTATAGTAPLKFSSGTLLSTPEAGAVEFNSDTLYFTQTTSTTRKKIAAYDDSSGATGDIYYRNSSGVFTRLAAGSNGQVLNLAGGIPAWSNREHAPTAIWGDGVLSSSITAGLTTYVRVPYSGTISRWDIIANASTTCTIDIWKAAGSLPTIANTITAAAKPSLSAATTGFSTTLTGWTTSVSAGDVFGFYLQSVSGSASEITLTLKVS
ncbi:hypothetical protein KDA23_04095 [Candidatus Saccharibacteria bacterium]|nr:hypothetical protein [Candidatus Saccharibacteria bacterium]